MKKTHFFLLILTGFLFYITNTAFSQNSIAGAINVTVQDEYLIPPDKSRLEAEKLLLQRARKKAIEQVTGVNVQVADVMMTTESGDHFFESYQQLVRNVVKGRIVDEQDPQYFMGGEGKLHIRYTCKVAEEKGKSDPGFDLEMEANKQVFTVGEELSLQVTPSEDAYLTIFSISEDNKVSVMFPNLYMSDNKVKAQQTRVIPNEKERQILSFTMQPSPTAPDESYSELLLCVATKSKVSFDELSNRLNYDSDWIELNKWLMKIPRDHWTEAYVQYQVFPN